MIPDDVRDKLLHQCPLCDHPLKEIVQDDRDRRLYQVPCDVCGTYRITDEVFPLDVLTSDLKQQLSAIARRHFEYENSPEMITSDNYKDLVSHAPDENDISAKTHYLLEYIGHKSASPGQKVTLNAKVDYPLCFAANPDEFQFHVRHATEEGFVEGKRETMRSDYLCWLTPKGWQEAKRVLVDASATAPMKISDSPESRDNMDSILQYLKEQYLQNPSQRPARVCPGLEDIMQIFGLSKRQCYELAGRLESLGLVEWGAKQAQGEFLRIQPAIMQAVKEPEVTTVRNVGGSVMHNIPVEITESLERFRKDHPNSSKVAFIMMRFGSTPAHVNIMEGIKEALQPFGLVAVRADEKEYHSDLWYNVLTYIIGCGFGIAVFERLEQDEFNPNASLEVGCMYGLNKPVCLLKDKTLKTLHSDLVGKLYRPFDPQDPKGTIPSELSRWIADKDIVR